VAELCVWLTSPWIPASPRTRRQISRQQTSAVAWSETVEVLPDKLTASVNFEE
jgi:hypothetical protein